MDGSVWIILSWWFSIHPKKHISWSTPKNLPAYFFVQILSGGGINAVEKKHALQIGSSPQLWVKIKNIWNHDFVPNKAIGWSFPQVDVNIQHVSKSPPWNHSTTCKPSLHSTFRSEDTLSPRHRQADVSKSCGFRGENHELQFLTICLFWGTRHSQSFSLIFHLYCNPITIFTSFGKKSPAYKTTHFFVFFWQT